MKASNNSLIGGKNKDNTIYKIKKGEKTSCIVGQEQKYFMVFVIKLVVD